MREILFRGKRISTGEWVFGGIMKTFHPNFDHENEDAFLKQAPNCYCICTGNKDIFVEQESIGQFTGMTDKNGRQIFEGDIVESEFTKKPYPVCFGEYTYTDEYEEESSACGWYNEEKGGYVTAFGCPDAWATVIGNIHDNPELMEDKL